MLPYIVPEETLTPSQPRLDDSGIPYRLQSRHPDQTTTSQTRVTPEPQTNHMGATSDQVRVRRHTGKADMQIKRRV